MVRMRVVKIPMSDARLLITARRMVGRSAGGIMHSAVFRRMLLVPALARMCLSCMVLRMLATSSSINLSTTLLAAEWIALDLRLTRFARVAHFRLKCMAMSHVCRRCLSVMLSIRYMGSMCRAVPMIGAIQRPVLRVRLPATMMPSSVPSLDVEMFLSVVIGTVVGGLCRVVVFIANCYIVTACQELSAYRLTRK